MPRQWLLLVPAVLGATLLLTGAWPGPVSPTSLLPGPLFLAQPVAVNHDLIGPEATGPQLLDRALAQLAPGRLTWLRTKVWQKMQDAKTDFEAEGTLDLGPGDCVRLDLAVRTPAAASRLLTICDGHVLAQVLHMDGRPHESSSQLLPNGPGHSPERLQFLEEKGCRGPASLLAGLRRHLRQIRLQTGTLQGRTVIQLKGELPEDVIAPALQTTAPARYACLFLDAQTLWPHRLEWWGAAPQHGARMIVQMEFRDPELNRALPLQECARLFSYYPGGAQNEER